MSRLYTLAMLALFCGTPDAIAQRSDAENDVAQEIVAVLDTQAAAWNDGDIPGFMKYYWQSDRLVFCSGGKRRRGWQKVFDGYSAKYDTPKKMGRLEFSEFEVTPLAPNVALVIGDWQLTFEEGAPYGGNFSLIMKQLENGWRVVHDHTSSREP